MSEVRISVGEGVSRVLRLVAAIEGKEVGHVYLFLICNDIHQQSYGFIEDAWIDPAFQRRGVASALLDEIKQVAVELGLYKLVLTARDEPTNPNKAFLPDWYQKLGFQRRGGAYRLDIKDGS